ncbi:LCP family protein [Bacillus sp. REN3]|uniref:LCP family protein n=1 Tax=Bacillus sp. REN3 TaxID=2802440 RepID=UPI001AEE8F8C|nr:LCP family protein [Bacillus sp. REN3]
MIQHNQSPTNRSDKAYKKKKRRRRNLLIFLIVLFLSAISFSGYLLFQTYAVAKDSYQELKGREEKSKLREEPVYISSDPFSVLLLGIENYTDENDHGRSDTIMLATFNPDKQTMKLVSIPRDTLVSIPEYKEDKINHAYSIGGKEMVIETVEGFLDIPIDYYVTVNFKGFTNIVDTLGGVTVDVPFDFNDINRNWDRFYFYEGTQKLSGEEALVYARMRKQDPRGDFGRNERQRQIVTGVIDQLSSPKTLLKIDDIASEIGNNIETNMRVKEALAFRKKYPDFNSSAIEQLELKGYDNYINSVYYFSVDPENLNELTTELKSHLELETEIQTDANSPTEDGSQTEYEYEGNE